MTTPALDTRTGEVVEILSADENDALADAEATIERGFKTFVEVGQALLEIRDSRLYRIEYATFEAYCSARWNLDRTRAYEIIDASETALAVSEISDIRPANEGQAKALRGLAAEEAAATMRQAHEVTNGKPTAKAIRQVVAERVEQQADKDVAEFPALQHYRETGRDDRVVALAADLRSFDEDERTMRLDVLDKTIAYEKREAAGEPHPRHLTVAPEPDVEPIPSVDQCARAVTASVHAIREAMTDADVLAGDIDYDDLPVIEEVARFLVDLATAVKEF